MHRERAVLLTGAIIIVLFGSLLLAASPVRAQEVAQYGPVIEEVIPAATYRGMPVQISGYNFCCCQLPGISKVTFNGVEAEVLVWSVECILALVPENATSGPVVVTTIAGASNPFQFTVLEYPTTKSCYLAEGTTRPGFEEWLTLYNPWDEDNSATVVYLIADSLNQYRTYNVPAHSRLTVSVNSEIGPGKDVSLNVTSPTRLFVERPMYFQYKEKWSGGHDTMPATQLSKTWYFAEGTTRPDFEEWLCLANPGDGDALVNVTYIFADGETMTLPYTVPALKRYTVDVNDAVGPGKDVALRIESNTPLVTERPMYFNYRSMWDDGHITMGAPYPEKTWYFAEGTTRQGFEEWLCLANPGIEDAQVRLTYHVAGEGDSIQDIPVPAGRRRTINVGDVIGLEKDVALKVDSDMPLVAERPMYFNYRSAWNGGHITMGATATSSSLYFAEGTTRQGFEEWLCLANPGELEAKVNLVYAFQDGGTKDQSLVLAPGQRVSIYVNEVVGPEKDVAVTINSQPGIVAERSLYFSYHGLWDGGSNAMGYSQSGQ